MRTIIMLAIVSLLQGTVLSQSTWYVDVTGVPPGNGGLFAPYTSIQYAIEQPTTLSGDTVLVRPGSYIETIDFLGKDLTVRSVAGPLSTVVTATPPPAAQVPAISIGAGQGAPSTFEGFAIVGSSPPDGRGGVIFCLGADAVVRNCVITNNDSYEASVWIEGSAVDIVDCRLTDNVSAIRYLDSSGTLEGCSVNANIQQSSAAAGLWMDDSDVVVRDCQFSDNEGNIGAAIYANNDSSLELEGCAFESNFYGSAVRLDGGSVVARDCTFVENRTMHEGGAAAQVYQGAGHFERCHFERNRTGSDDYWGGALLGWQSDLTVVDSVFLDNLSARGGAAYSAAGSALYTDSWFEGNRAVQQFCCGGGGAGGVGASLNSLASAERCVFVNNRADGLNYDPGVSEGFGGASLDVDLLACTLLGNFADDEGGGAYAAALTDCIVRGNEPDQLAGGASASYSNVEGGAAGPGNIDLPPLFTDADNGNYHLAPGSPCIDAGDPASAPDLDGSRADQGAFQYVDCNDNGIADGVDIAGGASLDRNANGFPDECECLVTAYCGTSPHSAGAGAVLSTAGSTSVSLDDLVLIASETPPGRPGLFFYGTRRGMAPLGDGVRCVKGRTYRLGLVHASPQGTAASALNLAGSPHGSGLITAGSRWYFQFWFRDPAGPGGGGGSGFNLSDALDVVFCP